MNRPRRIISLWVGNTIEVTGTIIGFILLFSLSFITDILVKFLVIIISWMCFWYFPHCLAHFIVGRILGIRFLYYFVGRSSLIRMRLPLVTSILGVVPVLGIKIDKTSILNISRNKVAIMYASGVLASMLCPLIPFTYSLIYLEYIITVFIGVITIGNIIFTTYFSSKVGDFSKAVRILHQAR